MIPENFLLKYVELNGGWTIQHVCEEARDLIRDNYDLDLSIIERARLKEFAIPVLREYGRVIERRQRGDLVAWVEHGFWPHAEVAARFMHQYYGIDIQSRFSQMNWFKQDFRDYLKLKQDQVHLF